MWAMTRAKIIDEAEADENHIEFARWQLYEFTASACELTDPDELDVDEDLWQDTGEPVAKAA